MRLTLLGLAVVMASPLAQATSLASSASQAGSSAASSASDSLQGSSRSSSGEPRAEGRYRVTEVAQAGAGRTRLTLQAEGPERPEPLLLTLPQQALAERDLQVGDAVQATPRAYGIEFAHADTRTAFFLVLDDAWHRELAARPLAP